MLNIYDRKMKILEAIMNFKELIVHDINIENFKIYGTNSCFEKRTSVVAENEIS